MILVRASHQMRAFEDRFNDWIAYRVIGGFAVWRTHGNPRCYGLFRVVLSPEDDLAFERINTPKRGLGDKAQQKIQNVARENGFVVSVDGARIALAELLGGMVPRNCVC